MDNMIWIGKKVYVSIPNINRFYSGVVINENEEIIIIRDIKGNQVSISKSSALIQEER